MRYSKFVFKYFLFSLLMLVVGISYTYLSIKSIFVNDIFNSVVYFIPSIIFFLISYYNFTNFYGVLDWIDVYEENEMHIDNNFNYFFYKDDESNGLYFNIIAFNIFISIDGKKLVNYVIQDILLSDDYTFIKGNRLYKIALEEVAGEILGIESDSEDYE